ncbi:MAG: S41 family peptidase [Bacteroides sp.]|nr:S41 family peptidase [Bacteroides sp.]
MKRRNLLLFPLLGLLALTSLFSCGVDRWSEYHPLTGRDLWMDSLMREVYLWYEDIPASKTLNYFQAPDVFLKSILSSKDKGYSTVDTLDNTPVLSYGFDYTLYKVATSDTTYNALITYVVSDSPAASAGLQRGEWIMLVDGDSITKNTEKWLTKGSSRELRIGKYVIVPSGGDEEEEEDKDIGVIQSDRNLILPAARAVTDSPIHTLKLFQLATGQKIAYLAYTSFTAGSTDSGNQEYNNELRQFSQNCKSAGVDNFVLDLRYNAGGEMECVQLLADILVPADKLESPLAYLQYNDKQSARNRDLILDSQLLQGGANLNLSTVYILTGSQTAGAAEMLINCLKPYMNVVLIGQTTKGENVATETFINPQYPYVLRPVVCEVFNSQDEADYSGGFKPDYAVSESSYLQYYLPLGNPEETLLNVALNIISGNIQPPTPETTRMTATKSVKAKRAFRTGLIIK